MIERKKKRDIHRNEPPETGNAMYADWYERD